MAIKDQTFKLSPQFKTMLDDLKTEYEALMTSGDRMANRAPKPKMIDIMSNITKLSDYKSRVTPGFSVPLTISVHEAIEVLKGLEANAGPTAPLTYDGCSIDVSDFIAHKAE